MKGSPDPDSLGDLAADDPVDDGGAVLVAARSASR
jgi:hypothetical protein